MCALFTRNLTSLKAGACTTAETGKILEFRSDEIESIQEKIAKDMGYEIVKHVHQLFVKKIK